MQPADRTHVTDEMLAPVKPDLFDVVRDAMFRAPAESPTGPQASEETHPGTDGAQRGAEGTDAARETVESRAKAAAEETP